MAERLSEDVFFVRVIPPIAEGQPCKIGGSAGCSAVAKLPWEFLHDEDLQRARFACTPLGAVKSGLPLKCFPEDWQGVFPMRLKADTEVAMQGKTGLPASASPEDKVVALASRKASDFRDLVGREYIQSKFAETRLGFGEADADVMAFFTQYLNAHEEGFNRIRAFAVREAEAGRPGAHVLVEKLSDERFVDTIHFLAQENAFTLDLAPFERHFGLTPLAHFAVAVVASCWQSAGSDSPVETLASLIDTYEVAPGGFFDMTRLREIQTAFAEVEAAKLSLPESLRGNLLRRLRLVDRRLVTVSVKTKAAGGNQSWEDFILDVTASSFAGSVSDLLGDVSAFARKTDRLHLLDAAQPQRALVATAAAARPASAAAVEDDADVGGGACHGCGDFCGREGSADCAGCAERCFVTTSSRCPSCQGPLPASHDVCECGHFRSGTWLCSVCHLPNRQENDSCRYDIHGCTGRKASSRPFSATRSDDKARLATIKEARERRRLARSESAQRDGGARSGGDGRGGKGSKGGKGNGRRQQGRNRA